MPARTLNDFFAGFFYGQIKIDIEVNMAILLQKGKERLKEIKVEGEREKEREVIVRHEIISPKRKVNVEVT